MRIHWILSIFAILMSMGLLVVIVGQYQELAKVAEQDARLQKLLTKFDGKFTNEKYFKDSLDTLLLQSTKAVKELEPSVTKLGAELDKKRTESDVCQSEKKTKNDELAEKEKARTDTEATLKSESDAWNQEIVTLKAQLAGTSPVCAHVKESSRAVAEKLCVFGPSTVTAPLATIKG